MTRSCIRGARPESPQQRRDPSGIAQQEHLQEVLSNLVTFTSGTASNPLQQLPI
jgi:hypothetical protein